MFSLKMKMLQLLVEKNNDIILKENSTEIRVGKHVNGDIYKKNKINPAIIKIDFNNNEKI